MIQQQLKLMKTSNMKNSISLFIALLVTLIITCCTGGTGKKSSSEQDLMTTRTLGLAYLEEFKFNEAAAEFIKFTEMAPGDKFGYANLGLTYLRMGNYPEAEKHLLKAKEIDPGDADIMLILATAYKLNDEHDKAVSELKKALSTAPAHIKVLYELSEIYSSENEEDSKIRTDYLQKLVIAAPENLVPRLNITGMLISSHEYDAALEQMEIIRKQFPEFPKEAVEYYDKTISFLHKKDEKNASLNFTIFHNYIKVTSPYQAGMIELKGPGGSNIGFPLITFDSKGMSALPQSGSILNLIKFTIVSEQAGLGNNPANTSNSVKNKTSHIESIDFDMDGDIDIYSGFYDPVSESFKHILFSNNSGKFTDITAAAGLNHDGAETSATFGDYDNDGFPDLFIIRKDGDLLYRNKGDGSFEDVTSSSHAGSIDGKMALFFDADHDGDLDLFEGTSAKNLLFRNNSDGSFTEQAEKMNLAGTEASDAAFADFDEDGDIDLFVTGAMGNSLYLNQRQSLYSNMTKEAGLINENGSDVVAVSDYNNDGFQDITILSESGKGNTIFRNLESGKFEIDKTATGALKNLRNEKIADAAYLDFDNDGLSDLFISGESTPGNERGIFLFHNEGKGSFTDASELLPEEIRSAGKFTIFDYNYDGDPDIAIVRPDGGIALLRNDGGNNNHYVKMKLVGLRAGSAKNNFFGIGAKVEIRAGDLYQSMVVTDPEFQFGLGPRQSADVIRITWTNGVPQNVLLPAADQALIEAQTLKGSCPFLYAWNGSEYAFVKDILWRSGLGMPLGIMGGNTAYAFADASDDYLKIPGEQLKEKNGKYSIQVTSELWETIYLDKLALVAVDHPASTDVYIEEQFSPPPFPGMKLFHVSNKIKPVSAVDAEGNDVLSSIITHDYKFLADFQKDRYQGTTELHDVIIDPGRHATGKNLVMYLTGWIFPTDASINVALSQSEKTKVIPPCVQVLNTKGEWETVIENISFPMGKDKTVIADLSGKFITDDHRIRIRTNMEIYWDEIFFSNGLSDAPVVTTEMEPSSADLHYRGFSAMFRKGERNGPHWFDYSRVSKEAKWRDLTGNYTRYGDVLPLLSASDNKYIIYNAGDEATISFNAGSLPDLKKGWKRDFLIRSVGWVKDGDINTAFGNTVLPLPYHGMKSYTPSASDKYPETPDLLNYNKEYNTRRVNYDDYLNSLKYKKADPSESNVTYDDITEEAGIDFRYTMGDDSYVNIIESSGSGVTVFDYNNDHLMDLYMLNGTWLKGISDEKGKKYKNTPDRLYRNNGDGTFTEVSGQSGLDDRHYSMAAGPVDYDNDGDQDLYLMNYGPNVFFRNNGNGTFTDITSALGLQGPDTLNGFTKWSVSAAYIDYNKDGRIDLLLGDFLAFDKSYDSPITPGLMPHPSEYKGQESILYEQQPDGKFRDVTKGSGLYYPDSKCMGLCVFDYDDDGDADIFQANDHHLNYMFSNNGGKFTETAMMNGVAVNSKGVGTGSMHGTPGDIDGDGLIDLLVTDLDYGALYRNKGNGIFEDVTWSSGVSWALTGKGGWGAALFDYDNDGDLDLVTANGTAEELTLQYPLLMENDGKGHFRDVGKEKGDYFRTKRSGRGLAVWDYDNDGDMDIIISHVDTMHTATLLRNNGGNSNHWLGLTLTGETPGSAIAAKVTITSGGTRQVFLNQFATSYLSYNDPRIHIGLGSNKIVDIMEISWMDGKKETYKNIQADRYISISEGKGIIEN
jgi:tetratricopeptide (TPR) repeat protein